MCVCECLISVSVVGLMNAVIAISRALALSNYRGFLFTFLFIRLFVGSLNVVQSGFV